MKNLNIESNIFIFQLQFLSKTYTENILKLIPKAVIETDIIGNLSKTGNWHNNITDDFKIFETITAKTQTIHINASLYQNAGANMVQQLAYTLSHVNEYLNFLEKKQANLSIIKVNFNLAVGSNYFFEIAKLKALRLLWETLAVEYNMNTTCYITATPTKRNKTIYDAETNLIRTTTECMSAILGGAQRIYNLPYDSIFKKTNTFSERIARNQLLILKHESFFNKVNNPSDGAYYIESLTNQLAEKALNLFKSIEKNGGFLKQLKSATIQRKIKESAKKEQEQFDSGESPLIGINLYPNPKETIKGKLELYPFIKTNPRKTLIEPIIEKRLTEIQEQKRLKNED